MIIVRTGECLNTIFMKQIATTFILAILTAALAWSDAFAQRDGGTLYTTDNAQAEWTHTSGISPGLNGTATGIIHHENYLLFRGSFTRIGDLSVSKLAKYNLNTGEWGSINYPGGIINDKLINENTLYVATQEGLWLYDFIEDDWQFDDNIPGRAFSIAWYEDSIVAAGDFHDDESTSVWYSLIRYFPDTQTSSVINPWPSDYANMTQLAVRGDTLIYLVPMESGFDLYDGIFVYDLINDERSNIGMLDNVGNIRSIRIKNDEIYLTGRFESLGQTSVKSVLKLDNEDLSPVRLVDPDQDENLFLTVSSVEIYGDDIFIGGLKVGNTDTHLSLIRNGEVIAIDGIPGSITSMLEVDGTLYITGDFVEVDGMVHSNVAAYDIETEEWLNLFENINAGSYFNNSVNAFTHHGDHVYFGGAFSIGYGIGTTGLVRHNLHTGETDVPGVIGLSPIPGGNFFVNALEQSGTNLFVGGRFSHSSDTNIRNIARYDMVSGEWNSLGEGLPTIINDIAIKGNKIYVGHNRTNLQGSLSVFDFTSSEWSAIEREVFTSGANVTNLAFLDEVLFIARTSSSWSTPPLGRYLIKMDTNTQQLSGFTEDFPHPVNDLYVHNGILYVATDNGLFEYDSQTDAFIKRSNEGSIVSSVYSIGDEMFVAGRIQTGEGPLQALASLSFETDEWTDYSAYSTDMSFSALYAMETDLYIGGLFNSIDGQSASNWARLSTSGEVVIPVDVPPSELLPNLIDLSQNFPNPFNSSTNIEFTTLQTGHVNLAVYNIMGQHVATLINEPRLGGTYTVNFDASGLASGVYVYSLRVGNSITTRKMTLLK